MAHILWDNPDGTTSVAKPIGQREGETTEQFHARVAAKVVPAGLTWRVVEDVAADAGFVAAEATIPTQKRRRRLKTVLTESKVLRLALEAIVDEFNRGRAWDASLMAAVAGANTLAQLKTAVAGMNNRPQITLDNVLTIIDGLIDTKG